MVFETLQHGILANEGASPPGHQICTLICSVSDFRESEDNTHRPVAAIDISSIYK